MAGAAIFQVRCHGMFLIQSEVSVANHCRRALLLPRWSEKNLHSIVRRGWNSLGKAHFHRSDSWNCAWCCV